MKVLRRRWRSARQHQGAFAFLTRRIEQERRFKRLIVLTTLLVVVLILAFFPWGWEWRLSETLAVAGRAIGVRRPREEVDESWRRYRQLQISNTRPRWQQYYAGAGPKYQRLLRYAGMDPEHGVLRWANYDWIVLFSSKVFEADDEGRSYRFLPRTRSVWLFDVEVPEPIAGIASVFYIVPDGPGLAEAIQGTSAHPLDRSRQTTNSWGLRGPEPEVDAPVRGIVLGDSFMQGMFIGDADTPPECLRRFLRERLATRVSILNTGVMGYSPEQYYYSLTAFIDRFRPGFVVASVYANDFGNEQRVVREGVGDWEEARYWLEKIAELCRTRHCSFLIVPAPLRDNVVNRRTSGYYPGRLLDVLDVPSLSILDPFDDFVSAYLTILAEHHRKGQNISRNCPLFNDDIPDDHFSAQGSRVWARSVGERVIKLLDYDRAKLGPLTEGIDKVNSGRLINMRR